MEQKDLAKMALLTLLLIISLPVASQMMQNEGDFVLAGKNYNASTIDDPYYEMSDQYFRDSSYDPYDGYSVNTYNHDYNCNYNYNYAYTLHSRCKKSYNGFNSDAYLHRRYDNSTNFSSGISSYQGTSTGPGPNGGYPGSPRGVYKTHYIPREY